MFLHVSVCPQGGVVYQHVLQEVSQHALQVSRVGIQAHTQGGAWGVWPGGGLQAYSQGGLQAHTGGEAYPSMHWGRPPPGWWLLLREVRILLECILVSRWIQSIMSIYILNKTTVSHFKCISIKGITKMPIHQLCVLRGKLDCNYHAVFML